MSNVLSVSVRGLSGQIDLELPEGATVADAREAAGINAGLSIRSDGETVSDEAATPLRAESVLVTVAPEAKHGLR